MSWNTKEGSPEYEREVKLVLAILTRANSLMSLNPTVFNGIFAGQKQNPRRKNSDCNEKPNERK